MEFVFGTIDLTSQTSIEHGRLDIMGSALPCP